MTHKTVIILSVVVGIVCAAMFFGITYALLHSPNYIYQYKRTTVWWNLAGEEVRTDVEYYDPVYGETVCYIGSVLAGLCIGALPYVFLQRKIKP